MILDKENAFFYKADLAKGTTGDIVSVGGDAYEQCFIVGNVTKVLSGAATVTLITSDKADMSSPTTLGTYTLAAETGSNFAARIPFGTKKYLQAKITNATSGVCTVAVAMDVRIVR
ncbi:hypothetical protein HMPREF0872_06790 [Veillonella montpellierensis DNF00314]|uniref:Uncharacterized protein n=1 Tax=Veillonella montpellierensis DNF00314 TaxID=1401067 RepID=A0A096BVU6_9FIRM|nr:hypothetical protein [Veillonella montpellierensis]KGF46837.1 hypothetical protein HMPREF0872_06790 [Veillonella montpellierensis DNF00314]